MRAEMREIQFRFKGYWLGFDLSQLTPSKPNSIQLWPGNEPPFIKVAPFLARIEGLFSPPI
jgi:hypothetical protein